MNKSEEKKLRKEIDAGYSKPVRKLARAIILNCPETERSFFGVENFLLQVGGCCAKYMVIEMLAGRSTVRFDDDKNLSN